MKWSEICIHTTNEAIEPISNILHEAGASGVVIEDADDFHRERSVELGEVYELDPADYISEGVYLKAYLPMNSFLGEAVEQIKQAINQLLVYDIDIGHNKITLSEVNEEEWATAWKKYYKPIRVSDHITITPTWEEYQPESTDELVIELDPGMAFGTGTHPTTILCIQAIEQYLKSNQTVVDVGTGSGVLSITAALLGAEHVYAYDLDAIAVKAAGINIKLNKTESKITVKQNNLLDRVTVEPDLIVANLLAEIIMRFEKDAFALLKPGGLFITSGIIKAKEDDVKNALIDAGFEIVETNYMKDWVLIVAKKPA
ncbi:50S ribosomal protein L11 methyltransferase [Amphibacillus xylanus]|uniref:Ribosomal protein L11 methyltransferase n=1 Tax=Amphibacillus xylanus (strain ATCC 51415 / DSM 6626 / JCM 7361 / LMG 17667 / NBRC 15112 / Ep01) TaxID=698758 RepID=K0IXV1_AMPXN|nr:50S ribosomal protein L11 methyltransferase [Amphibacillus xylanus]BAM47234.1 ribosomal protein L11 methyltransferase [Amphibacillus xylanus NBRC 15112]